MAGGHVLFEDVPGTAKTILARALAAASTGATFSRIQCTPDLQPTDVTGLSIFDQRGRASSSSGPARSSRTSLLVDEINRAMPKTQSALLEAMAEAQVTVEGVTRALPRPFLVLATAEPDRAGGHVPAARGPARPFLHRAPRSAIPPRRRSCRSSSSSGAAGRSTPPARRVARGAPLAAGRDRARLRRPADPRAGSSGSCVRRANSSRSPLGASVRASLALERVARAWALVHGPDLRRARRHRAALHPCRSVTGSPSTRSHSPITRPDIGALLESVWASCLARVPRPEPDWDLAAQATARRRRFVSARRPTFPLVPRRPPTGIDFGMLSSARRGPGSDVAGSRPYRPGDRLSSIDWHASARFSAVREDDEFIVRETFRRARAARGRRLRPQPVDEPLRPRPAVPLKPAAVREAVAAIVASARAARAGVGWLDVSGGRDDLAPAAQHDRRALDRPALRAPVRRPPDGFSLRIAELLRRGTERPKEPSFSSISDYLDPSSSARRAARPPRPRRRAGRHPRPRLGVSFPAIGGVLLPVADPSGRASQRAPASSVAAARARRDANERRARQLRRALRSLGSIPSSSRRSVPAEIDAAFAAWAARRRAARRARVHA